MKKKQHTGTRHRWTNREERMAFCKKGKMGTYRAHRTLIWQRNFESLANEVLFSKEDLPQLSKKTWVGI